MVVFKGTQEDVAATYNHIDASFWYHNNLRAERCGRPVPLHSILTGW
jgi:hypothetical protein